MNEPEREDKDQLWSEATLWFARMRSPDAEALQPEFEDWLARGALHRRYYNRAAEYWVDSGTALSENTVQDTVPSRQETVPEHHNSRGATAALVATSVFVASSMILVVAHYRGDQKASSPPMVATQATLASSQFATAAGKRRWVQLADGSAILLASDTILRVQLGRAMRRLELDRGKARFEVAHEARPFVVFAGGGSVTAHGTVFDVNISSNDRVSVRLIRGSVDVMFPAYAKTSVQHSARRLQPGETISFHAAVAISSEHSEGLPSAPADAAVETARDYHDVRLAEIVAEANRHAGLPIRFADRATGEQKVSGRFRTDDTAVLAERFAALFDLVVDRGNGAEIVLRPK